MTPFARRFTRYSLFALLALVLLYAIGRPIDVWLGSFYSGARAPYLQMPAPDAVTLRWQAPGAVQARVRYGASPEQLEQHSETQTAAEQHEVRLNGLKADTRYYYAIDHNGQQVYGGEEYFFRTAPATGIARPIRLWVIGDPGYAGERRQRVRRSAFNWMAEQPRPGNLPQLDVWLTTGDNAYTSGSNTQFQEEFFSPLADLLRHQPIWPAYGNHDDRRRAFFKIFSLPQNAEAGGLASGTEHYYSFDYANLHVIMLDSQASDLDKNSAMLKWLKADLAATRQPWRIAVLHHPPYTQGGHNSDSKSDSDGRMFEIRRNILPLLEQGGVQLVLSGHSHVYERSYPLRCHYGTSDTIEDTMILDRQTGEGVVYSSRGTVYAVVGSSSKLDHGPLEHPAMAVSMASLGSLIVDIAGDRMTARFIDDQGKLRDAFVIRREPGEAANPSDGNAACR